MNPTHLILSQYMHVLSPRGQKKSERKYDVHLVQFLIGLNDYYCIAKDNIFMISPLLSTANVYSLLISEEKQMEIKMNPKFFGENSSFVAFGQNTS